MKALVIKKKNGTTIYLHFLAFCFLIILIVLMGGNSKNPDIVNYSSSYYRNSGNIEGAWIEEIIVRVCNSIGMTFNVYRLLLSVLGLLIIFIANNRLTGSKIFFLLYFICPFIMDSTQIDNFLCMAFIFLGYSYIVDITDRIRVLKFCICVVIAAGFHIIAFIYLPVLLLLKLAKTEIKRRILIMFAAIYALMTLFVNVSSLANVVFIAISTVIPSSDYMKYFNSMMGDGKYLFYGLHVLSCLFTYYIKLKTEKEDGVSDRIKKITDVAFWFNIYILLFLPIVRFEATLFRLSRNLLVIDYAAGILAIKSFGPKSKAKIVAIILLCLVCGLYSYFTFVGYLDTIIIPFFESNWIVFGG